MTPDHDRSTDQPMDGEETRVIPDPDDQGKDVIDRTHQNIGLVTAVGGDTLYVDPHPSLTEMVASKLGWGGEEGEKLPVSPDFVDEITDDEVVLSVKGDEEFQEEGS